MRYVLTILLLMLTGCALTAEPQARPDAVTIPPLEFHPPQVEKVSLANGIHLYLLEDHELPLVEVTAMAAAGSLRVPAGKEGLADLHASLVRAGGAGDMDPAAFDELLEQRAIDLEASADSYTFTIDLSARREDLPVALQALADLVRRPRFDAGRFELLKKQMQESVRRRHDNPGTLARDLLLQQLYPGHPLGRQPTIASLQAVQREDVLAFHHHYLAPDNLWLAVSGDFDAGVLRAELERLFGDWRPAGVRPEPVAPVGPAPAGGIYLAQRPLPQTTVMFGELGVTKDNPDIYALRVMNYILGGGGFNSRLMREIRSNRGLAYSVYSYFQIGRRLPGPFVAGCETKTGSTVEVLELMRSEMERIQNDRVGQQELALARESLANSFIFAFENSHDIVSRQMRLDFYGYPPDYLQRYPERIKAVSAEDVLRVARKYLHPDRQVLVLVGDTEAFAEQLERFGLPVVDATDSENRD